MGVRRSAEFLLLLVLVACLATVLAVDEPAPHLAEPKRPATVDRIQLGMSMKAVQVALGPDFEPNYPGGHLCEFRRPGLEPHIVICEFTEDWSRVVAVSGRSLNLAGEKLECSKQSWERWSRGNRRHKVDGNLRFWRTPNVTYWLRMGKAEDDTPIQVGMWSDQHRDSPLPATYLGYTSDQFSVCGIKLGMSETEVVAVLGEPEPEYSTPNRWSYESGIGVESIELEMAHGAVTHIQGPTVEFEGRVLASLLSPRESLLKTLGEPDHVHGYGVGGTPVDCWSNPLFSFEAIRYGDEGEQVVGFLLFVPRPEERGGSHLWFTSCRGL